MAGLALTFIKPLITGLILYFLFHHTGNVAAIIILFLMLCDIFDGILFRQSKLGLNAKLAWFRRVFDVLGDRFALLTVLIFMVIYYRFPLYLCIVVGVREFFLLVGWICSIKIKKQHIEPNLPSRLSTLSIGLMVISWLIIPTLTSWFLLPIIGFGIIGFYKYFQTLYYL